MDKNWSSHQRVLVLVHSLLYLCQSLYAVDTKHWELVNTFFAIAFKLFVTSELYPGIDHHLATVAHRFELGYAIFTSHDSL